VSLLAEVVRASAAVAATSSRLAKIRVIADCLRALAPEEIEIALPWLSGEIRQGKLALGFSTLQGAMGDPAAASGLSVAAVDQAFQELKTLKGKGSAAARQQALKGLFGKATTEEQDFLLRLIVGELRQGALEGVMLEAVAAAAQIPAAEVRRAATLAGGIPKVARAALSGAGLAAFSIRLMQPVLPMLAQPAEDIAAALEDLGTALLEWKLDGARVQVHKSGSDTRVYTRNLNEVTARVPEVAAALKNVAASLILDGEVIALRADGRPHPFQTTMRRFGRRLDVERMRSELPVRPVWFDALYLNGGSLIDEAQQRRFQALQAITAPETVAPHLFTSDPERAAEFVKQALAAGHEGVMAKSPGAPYAAGARGSSWLKIKQARTLDLVILAAEWGSGRRRGWLSNLHLGARDTVKGGFAMLGKTFKGLTDEMLEWQTQEFLKIEVARDSYTVYLEPRIVAEIAFNEIQVSTRYPSGLALRFARVKRYRPDKPASESDTFQTVQAMSGLTAGPSL
jgi:DNA ligase-1